VIKKLFENVNNHILSELGYEFIKKRKQYKDKKTNKMKSYNTLKLSHSKILNDYLLRKEEQGNDIKEVMAGL